jgi:hypothetical protein
VAVIAASAVAGVLVSAAVLTRLDPSTAPGLPADSGHGAVPSASPLSGELVIALTKARRATVRYATNLPAAQADGYKLITTMMADMGVHYLKSDIQGFDLEKPPILVYFGEGDRAQLGALEWVFPETPASPPLPGATYGSFDAACHYADGQFIGGGESSCEPNHPITNAPFLFWHPRLVTLHVWLWFPNPDGLYHDTNPLVRPYNDRVTAQPQR